MKRIKPYNIELSIKSTTKAIINEIDTVLDGIKEDEFKRFITAINSSKNSPQHCTNFTRSTHRITPNLASSQSHLVNNFRRPFFFDFILWGQLVYTEI